jgi:hypothetical protein
MYSIKFVTVIAAAGLLCLQPSGPASAGSREAAIAAGIVGAAIGTALIMQHRNAGAAPRRVHRTSTRKPEVEKEAAGNSKDPFAGVSAPADYAKPVSTRQP